MQLLIALSAIICDIICCNLSSKDQHTYVLADSTISDNTLTLSSRWDRDSIYFHFEMDDLDLYATQTERDDPQLFLDDMCEVLLDPRMDRSEKWLEDDLIYHVNLLGAVRDDRGIAGGGQNIDWNGNARCTASSREGGYTITISIPWTEIGLRPRRGLKIGINFGFCDRDSVIRERKMVFFKKHFPTRTPSAFGTLVLR